MKITKLQVIAIALAIMITTGVVAGISSARQFNFDPNSPPFDQEQITKCKDNNPQRAARKQAMQGNREAIMQALESNNYQAWLDIVGVDSPMGQAISEDEFPRLIEAHQLMQESKEIMQQAKEIKEELGLLGFKKGHKGMNKDFNQ
ncbi:hypothetical protein ACFL2U_02980 [Patescibacteria group bacterium]